MTMDNARTKTVRVDLTIQVVDECNPDPDAPCEGGDHHGFEVNGTGGFQGVPPEDLAEAIARAVAHAGAQVTYTAAKDEPLLASQLESQDGGHEHSDGAPTAEELDALVGDDPDLNRPGFPLVRSAEELAELMKASAESGVNGGVVMMEPQDMEAVLGKLGALLRDARGLGGKPAEEPGAGGVPLDTDPVWGDGPRDPEA